MIRIKNIDLQKNNITYYGAIKLCNIVLKNDDCTIERLNLEGNFIGDKGAKLIC